MLLDTTILILRETLEASTLLAVLFSISVQNGSSQRWIWLGAVAGGVGAVLMSVNFSVISEWFDYTGQEVLNAAMQFMICLSLISIALWRLQNSARLLKPAVLCLFFTIVALALARELTEIAIFYSGILQSQISTSRAFTGGFVGLTIGASIGVLVFTSIERLTEPVQKIVQIVLLILVAAGTAVQALQLLMQVDWISATPALWNTNWILEEASVVGQMLYAVFGYEATPTLLEVIVYFLIIITPMCAAILNAIRKPMLATL